MGGRGLADPRGSAPPAEAGAPVKVHAVRADREVQTAQVAPNESNASLAAIRHLRWLSELVHDRDHPSAAWFVAKLAEYENSVRADFTLDEILGLTPRRGGRSWHSTETLLNRDRWLRLAAERHFAGPSIPRQIVDALTLFAASADWRKEKVLAEPPAAWRGTEREAWFWVLKADGDVLAVRTVPDILKRR